MFKGLKYINVMHHHEATEWDANGQQLYGSYISPHPDVGTWGEV